MLVKYTLVEKATPTGYIKYTGNTNGWSTQDGLKYSLILLGKRTAAGKLICNKLVVEL